MKIKIIVVLLLCYSVIALAGCATASRRKDLELQGLKNQISVLETQLRSKDEEIIGLRDALGKIIEEKDRLTRQVSKKRVIGEIKSRPNIKQIQIALRNAGFNPGPIDGRMGKQTREAIRVFQRENNLSVDGRLGRQTWNLLKEYLYKKVK